ncbi:MAG: hypothetical protein ACYSUQ_02665 [Planctomycetota bacterium]
MAARGLAVKGCYEMDESLKRNILIGVIVVVVAVAGYYTWSSLGESKVVRSANTRTLKCSETGKLFEVQLTTDMPPYPHENPRTGRKTLYPTEVCYWNQCGQKGGTRVILNQWLDQEDPTYCPVCGQVVRPHNPAPPGWKGPQ